MKITPILYAYRTCKRVLHAAIANHGLSGVNIQELSYRKQIAHQLRTQYVEGIYPVTLKSNLRGTQGRWGYHWIDITRLDVEYYRHLEVWVKGHSRSLKLVPFESLGMVSYWPSIVTMAVSLAISEIFSVKEWPDLEIWVCHCKWRNSIDHVWLSISPPLQL